METISDLDNFSKNLKNIRLREGKSQTELASIINVNPKTIARWESGEADPTFANLRLLAEKLNTTIDEIIVPDNEFNELKNNFIIKGHREKNIRNELEDSIKDAAIHRIMKMIQIESTLEIPYKFNNPLENFKSIKSKKDAEEAALQVRKKWNLGNSPILSVISCLEQNGIRVIELDAPKEFHGLSGYIKEEIPVIVLNCSVDEITRKRFTAMHELSHLILTIAEEIICLEDIERICDAFAGSMLLPSELLFAELGRKRTKISKNELVNLKEKYGISFKALLVGAAINEIIPWEEYSDMSKNHVVDLGEYVGSEKATRFEQLVHRGIVEGLITKGKAKQLIDIDSRQFKLTHDNANNIWNL